MAQTAPARQSNLVALVTAVRWGTTTVGLLWSAVLEPHFSTLLAGVVLLAYALWRTLRPVEYSGRGWRSLIAILGELTLSLVAIVGTGCWESPYIFVLFTPVIAAGFERGIWHSLRVALTGLIAVTIAAYVLELAPSLTSITSWACELLLVACVASYGSHLLERAEHAAAMNLSQLRRLNQANALLVSLNDLAHDMPAPFDMKSTLESALEEVHANFDAEVTVLLLLDRLTDSWTVAHARGVHLHDAFGASELPSAVTNKARMTEAQMVDALSADNRGFAATSVAGIYAPLWSGATQVGLLAIETSDINRLQTANLSTINELGAHVALSIDNARRFERLQARGATQERNRIARDLHDRVGQGVAYVAFELDRLCSNKDAVDTDADLQRLRDDAREIVAELREALYDLRTDVSNQQSLVETIDEFLRRVSQRSGISVSFEHDEDRRLPVADEREVWRIAQESIVNAERHADAERIEVSWCLDANGGLLTIRDDGEGINRTNSDGRPSYGITGMRERAGVIGARLEIGPAEPSGTAVKLILGAVEPGSAVQSKSLNQAEDRSVRT